MQESSAVRPSFSGASAPVLERRGRLPAAAAAARVRIPKRLLADDRRAAGGIRPRKLKRLASAAAKPSVEQRLVQRATMGMNLVEMQRVDELGYDEWLEYQLDYESIDDSEIENVISTFYTALGLSASELISRYEGNQGVPVFQLIASSIVRATYSPRQLYERMVIFWTDHFNIHLFADGQPLLKPVDHREVIRKHAMGKFPDLLSASAHSPSMLLYLTNDSNVRGHPNENYARELMELHTLGVDNGYTQKDVREVARCFTGWGITGYRGANAGEFMFRDVDHDNGTKVVLGETISSGGIEDGERVLEILGNRKRTAKYLAKKLLVYFWGYEPKKRDINKVANAYMNTDGDIKAMLRQVLKKGRMERAQPKLKRPFHLMVSGLRALFAGIDNPSHMLDKLFTAGNVPFNWEPPDGYPDSELFWSGFVLPRWNWATTFLNTGGGVNVDLPFVDPSLKASRIVGDLNAFLFNGAMSAATEASLLEFLESGKKIDKKRIHDLIGLAVASPDFQEY